MATSLRTRFDEIVGKAHVHAEGRVIIPPDEAALLNTIRACADTHTPVVITSSDDRDAPSGALGVRVSVAGLTTIHVDAASLTVRTGGGAALADVQAAVAAAGLALVGVPADAGSTHMGSLVARGAVPRRSLTGIEAVLGRGERVRFGGAILKDVAGYDVAAVLLGSMGRCAVISAVTWRLQPVGTADTAPPPRSEMAVASGPNLQIAFDPEGLFTSDR